MSDSVKMPPLGSLVVVTWIDAKSNNGWQKKPDFHHAMCQTVGWLSAVTDLHIVLMGSRGDPDSLPWADPTAIPYACIQAVRVLPVVAKLAKVR